MTCVSRCPSCWQPIDVVACAHHGTVSCPNCGTQFSVPESGDQAGIAVKLSSRPRGVSRLARMRKRPKRVPVAIVAILASASLLLAVVLAVALGWHTGSNSNRRGLSPANTVHRKPQSTLTSRPDVAARPGRSARVRATSPTDSVESFAERNRVASATSEDDRALSNEPESSDDNASPAETSLGPAPSALADALVSAERPVASSETETTDESPEEGTPNDFQDAMPQAAPEGEEPRELSRAERRRLAEIARLKKLLQRHFIGQRRTTDRTRGQADDYFVVAKYEMPLATRMVDLRFEVSQEVDTSVDQVADFMLTTPTGALRDFQVVARFDSMSDAEEGVAALRQRYDQAKEYQAQLLAFLRFQASAIRRC